MNDCLKCKFCGSRFAVGTSISRIKSHFSGVEGHGVKICKRVSDDVKAAALADKRLKTVRISSSYEVRNAASTTSSQELANDIENEWRYAEMGDGREEENLNEEFMQPVERGKSSIRPEVNTHELTGNALQTTDQDLVGQAASEPWHEMYSQLMEDHETDGDALLTTKLVGEAFGMNMDKIWGCLMRDEVLSIGIYGMGGVGKTLLVAHIYNQLRETRHSVQHVYWITVSHDFTIHKLQNLIAKTIGLDLSNEDDERKRAAILSKALISQGKCVLVLDYLWNHFPLLSVGIPVEKKGCKLIITTRSLEVCQRMGCQEAIKVEPLTPEEAWNLFVEKLDARALPPEVVCIAKSVVRECAGLPLGIITMAGSMREVNDVYDWRNALKELKESKVRLDDMEPKVFRILRFSYDHLNDLALRQCFLYCALFPENFKIYSVDLINYLIVEGIIKGEKSRQAEFDYSYTMLTKLENRCLLEGLKEGNYRYVKMHDLIRDMALQIMKESPQAMVEAGEQIEEMPDEGDWTENLEWVSLMENWISEVDLDHTPRCPNLSTLLLCGNPIKRIKDSFFKQMRGLKVLDLSRTHIKVLPNSVSDLASLTALIVRNCLNLRYVPSLEKLQALRMLDLSETGLEEVPQGLELLCNLRHLDLWGTQLRAFPAGMLPLLSRLQFLRLGGSSETTIMAKGEELACLKKLEIVRCIFCNLLDFNKYLKSRGEFNDHSVSDCDKKRRLPFPHTYEVLVGPVYYCPIWSRYISCNDYNSKAVTLWNCNISEGGDFLALPKGIQKLLLSECHDMRSLCNVPPLKHAPELKYLEIWYCNGIECLFKLSNDAVPTLENLEHLELKGLKNLSALCSRELAAPLPSNATFSRLKSFGIRHCNSMKNLFSPALLRSLQNLESIVVELCDKMEEIIARKEE